MFCQLWDIWLDTVVSLGYIPCAIKHLFSETAGACINMSPSQIEDKVRKIMERRFKQPFTEQEIQLHRTTKMCRFDLVSKDRTVISEIKCCTLPDGKQGSNGYSSTKKMRCVWDLFRLERVRARKKLLVLTDKPFWERLNKDLGKLTKVKIVYVNLRTNGIQGL
jgi:hypothetical protein